MTLALAGLAASAAVLALPGLASAAAGDLDPSYGTTGRAPAVPGSTNVGAVLQQPDGSTLVAGTGLYQETNNSMTAIYVGKYTSAGAPDSSFGGLTTGAAETDISAGFETPRGIARDSSGRIYVTGYAVSPRAGDDSNAFLYRLTPQGRLDPTFGGVKIIDRSNHDRASAVAVSGNRVLVALSEDAGGNWGNQWTVAAYTATGAPDTTFGGGDGIAEVPTTKLSTFDGVRDLLVQPDGKIVLGGSQLYDFATARLTATGALDSTYSGDGVATTPIETGGVGIRLALQPDKKILLAGQATVTSASGNRQEAGVVRFNANGTLDTSFSGDGKVAVTISDTGADKANGIAVGKDGKIVLAGVGNTSTGPNSGLVRLNWNGTYDLSFSGDGRTVLSTNDGYNEAFEAVTVDAADRIVVAGENGLQWVVARYTGGAVPLASVAGTSLTEPNSGTANATFKISLSAPSTNTVTVRYATAPGTATAPADFTTKSGTVTFAPGQVSSTVTVPVVGDTVREANETFKVTVSLPTNAGIGTASGTGTIVNND
jgi:uncharacterized delta-60 repeat protein